MQKTNELICIYRNYISDKLGKPNKPETPISILSPREIVVMILVVEGSSNKEIASILYISIKTVKNHVSNIFKKMNVSNRVEAVVFALENNITNMKEALWTN